VAQEMSGGPHWILADRLRPQPRVVRRVQKKPHGFKRDPRVLDDLPQRVGRRTRSCRRSRSLGSPPPLTRRTRNTATVYRDQEKGGARLGCRAWRRRRQESVQRWNIAVRLGCPCRRERACTHVLLGAHWCRGLSGSDLGLDLAAKRRGNADRGGAARTITGESAGACTSPGPNVRVTGEADREQGRGLGPLPVGSGSSWPRRSSGWRQRWRRTRSPQSSTDA
jgi:hypothetical protein